jgi:hypothetical protein
MINMYIYTVYDSGCKLYDTSKQLARPESLDFVSAYIPQHI